MDCQPQNRLTARSLMPGQANLLSFPISYPALPASRRSACLISYAFVRMDDETIT